MSSGCHATVSEFEYGAQLLRRSEIGHHLGEHNQPVIPAQVIYGRKDVALNHADVQCFSLNLGADDVGELGGHFDRVHRVAASRQRQGVAPGPGANIEHPQGFRISCFAGQRPHPRVRLGAEQRWLAVGDPILVSALDRRPFGFHVVVQNPADRRVVRDDNSRPWRRSVSLGQLTLQHSPETSKFFRSESNT